MKDPGKRNQFKTGFLRAVLAQFTNTHLAEINDFWFKIKTPCSNVDPKHHDFTFTLNDGTKTRNFTIPGHEMLIDSEVFGFTDNHCFSAVFYT